MHGVTQPAPPLKWLIAYRLLGLRLPEEHRPWVAEDVATKGFLTARITRLFLWLAALVGLYVVAYTAMFRAPDGRFVLRLLLGALALSLLASGKTLVRQTLRWQRIDKRGRPVAPKRLAVLDNRDALVLGLAVAVAFTNAAALFAYALNPYVDCKGLTRSQEALIKAGFKESGTKIKTARVVPFADNELVVAFVDPPGEGGDRLVTWVFDGQSVSEVRQKDAPSLTTFPPLEGADRVANEALLQGFECLTGKSVSG